MKMIKDRKNDYNVSNFVNELANATKLLGVLEGKIDSYRFNNILVPMLQKKEAISSMYIEGTQTTMSDVFENEVDPKEKNKRDMLEVANHTKALLHGATYLRSGDFSHEFIQQIHGILMKDIISKTYSNTLGVYKLKDNKIVNSVNTVIFTPPAATETNKYMSELIDFMNTKDDVHPLIKAAIIHAQFESIHPFSDGNGRVGRILISLYLFKAGVIKFPFFYISEAISIDKTVYYNMLSDTRVNNYDKWIKYFLSKISIQALKLTNYIDSLNELYQRTKEEVYKLINSSKCDDIIRCLFTNPVLKSSYFAEKINVSKAQANRYLTQLENHDVLMGDDKKRNRKYYFMNLIDLARGL